MHGSLPLPHQIASTGAALSEDVYYLPDNCQPSPVRQACQATIAGTSDSAFRSGEPRKRAASSTRRRVRRFAGGRRGRSRNGTRQGRRAAHAGGRHHARRRSFLGEGAATGRLYRRRPAGRPCPPRRIAPASRPMSLNFGESSAVGATDLSPAFYTFSGTTNGLR